MYSSYDIIMLALPRWDSAYTSTAFSLAKELSRHTRVFYVDNPVSMHEYLKSRNTPAMRRRRGALFFGEDIFSVPDANYPQLHVVTPRLTIPINWLPAGRVYDRMSRLNDALLSGSLRHLIRIFGIQRYILVNSFNPLIARKLSLTAKPLLTVYQSVDDISQAPYMAKHGVRLENEAIAKADFTVVTSSHLKHIKSALSKNVFLLPNAANTALFRSAVTENLPVPEEIQHIRDERKIICYMGNICQRIDYGLLEKIAITHTDKIILMVGPKTKTEHGSAALKKYKNIIFTGGKPANQLPAYLKYSHCCIIPFLCNQLTRSIYPLKINEYLSAGKPIVTTNFSKDIAGFKDVTYVSEGQVSFIDNIQRAIDEDSEKLVIERMIFSSVNDWEARAHHFIGICEEFLEQYDRRRKQPVRRKREQIAYRQQF